MLFSVDMMVVIVKGLNPGVIIFVSRWSMMAVLLPMNTPHDINFEVFIDSNIKG